MRIDKFICWGRGVTDQATKKTNQWRKENIDAEKQAGWMEEEQRRKLMKQRTKQREKLQNRRESNLKKQETRGAKAQMFNE